MKFLVLDAKPLLVRLQDRVDLLVYYNAKNLKFKSE